MQGLPFEISDTETFYGLDYPSTVWNPNLLLPLFEYEKEWSLKACKKMKVLVKNILDQAMSASIY